MHRSMAMLLKEADCLVQAVVAVIARALSNGRSGRKGKRWCHGVVGVDLSASKPPQRAEGTQGGGHQESHRVSGQRLEASTKQQR